MDPRFCTLKSDADSFSQTHASDGVCAHMQRRPQTTFSTIDVQQNVQKIKRDDSGKHALRTFGTQQIGHNYLLKVILMHISMMSTSIGDSNLRSVV